MIKMFNDHQFFRRCLLTMGFILFYLNTANSNTTESPTSTEAPPIQCGRTAFPQAILRIVGGSSARHHSWPWMVSINTAASPASSHIGRRRGHACGGVLISDEWVLTAAHCLDNYSQPNTFPSRPPVHWSVTAGMHNRDATAEEARRWQQRGIKRFFYHPRFRDLTYAAYNDIALLQLNTPVKINNYVRPICLPHRRVTTPGWHRCYVAGWGTTAEGSSHYSLTLQEVQMPVVNSIFCRTTYRSRYNSAQHLCGGDWFNGKKDSCKGDSGGPLACQLDNGSWYVAGVVSWGLGCGRPETPGIYTNVRNYESWILAVMGHFSPESLRTYQTGVLQGK